MHQAGQGWGVLGEGGRAGRGERGFVLGASGNPSSTSARTWPSAKRCVCCQPVTLAREIWDIGDEARPTLKLLARRLTLTAPGRKVSSWWWSGAWGAGVGCFKIHVGLRALNFCARPGGQRTLRGNVGVAPVGRQGISSQPEQGPGGSTAPSARWGWPDGPSLGHPSSSSGRHLFPGRPLHRSASALPSSEVLTSCHHAGLSQFASLDRDNRPKRMAANTRFDSRSIEKRPQQAGTWLLSQRRLTRSPTERYSCHSQHVVASP